jgi:hypothetical protein
MNQKRTLLALVSSIFFSYQAYGSIAPQMINLNMQFKSHSAVVNSELSMPMYQTAEIEKQVGKKNYLISLNPRHGKNPDEVHIEVKFLRHSNLTAFYKTEIITKINQKASFTAKGVTINLTPII